MDNKNNHLTIAYIRDSITKNYYIGDLFEALKFMIFQYDSLWQLRKDRANMSEYEIHYS